MAEVFNNKNLTSENLVADMKKNIEKVGGLFYQYRPCTRNASTIYDIENIRHNVVYAQTPLNMNDPFDSMIGFSAEKIYTECMSMLMETINVNSDIKAIIASLLQHRAFGKMGQLISDIQYIKDYLISFQTKMHKKHIPLESFIKENFDVLYSKANTKIKEKFDKQSFAVFSMLIVQLKTKDISEKEIVDLYNLDHTLGQFHQGIIKIQEEQYLPNIKKFLSQLTVSCFTASGWNNQLMWSHYANAYSGICVEYDFTKISDSKFIGFFFPVNYTSKRPTLSLQDLGLKLSRSKDGKVTASKIQDSNFNMNNIMKLLLYKNNCWSYENEWRIINFGDENTPKFINLPYIKSITFGLNIDPLCKRLLFDVCKDKKIACYKLSPSADSYDIDRIPISEQEMLFDYEEEIKYIYHLSILNNNMLNILKESTDNVCSNFENKSFDYTTFKQWTEKSFDFLSNIYFLKASMQRIAENASEKLSDKDITSFSILVNQFNNLLLSVDNASKSIESALIAMYR